MKRLGIGPLLNFYNRLEKSDIYHSIAGIMLKNITRLGSMSIQETADICFTSSATISRLSKRAGYEGFNDLKEEASQYCTDYFRENRVISPDKLSGTDAADVYLNTVISMFTALNQTFDREILNRAVRMIDQADAVYYFGTCDAARRLQQDLFVQGKYVEVYQVFGAESPNVIEWKDNCVAVVENPGYPWFEFDDMIRRIKQFGVKVLLVTCGSSQEVQDLADVCIRLSGTKSGLDEVLYLAVMTILSLEYRKQCMDSWYYR